jgi:methyl-accepting chemotaxis protein
MQSRFSLPRSLVWKIILPVPLAIILGAVAMAVWLPSAMERNVEQSAIRAATETVNQFKTIRGYYTEKVVGKVVENGALKPTFDHESQKNTIPLPATMIHDLSKLLSAEGTRMSLFSAYPFPNRKERVLDDFQKEAWKAIIANPDKPFVRREVIDGKTTVRVGIADKMVAQGCVTCHNTRSDTPKNDWKMGDVRGVLEVSAAIDDQLAVGASMGRNLVIATVGFGTLIVALLVFLAIRSVGRPLGALKSAMVRLSDGDRESEIPLTGQRDEIGDMAQTVEFFKQSLIENERLQAERRNAETRAQEEERKREAERIEAERKEVEQREREAAERQERADRVEKLIGEFDSQVSVALNAVASAASQMQLSAQNMSASADQTNRQATTVAAASEEATTNVQTVASATEELSSSIAEISRQVAQSNQIAQNAIEEAKQTNAKVEGLAEAAQKIGDVVSLINDIASQTNLLALNATIEAARAGEAGKGFAVVASEVKSLATQTSRATEEIGAQIAAIQGATDEAVQAIQGIGSTIGQIGEIATSVASAVEEQGAATREIANNVQQAATGTQEVSGNITQVTKAAGENQTLSGQMLQAANDLAKQGEKLREEVDRFLASVRAA